MRNAKEKKRLDLRKSFRGCRAPDMHNLVLKKYPELNDLPFSIMHNLSDQIIYDWIGLSYGDRGCGEIPKHFRQCLNRRQRSREKSAINNAYRNNDWDDFDIARPRRNLRYNYW